MSKARGQSFSRKVKRGHLVSEFNKALEKVHFLRRTKRGRLVPA